MNAFTKHDEAVAVQIDEHGLATIELRRPEARNSLRLAEIALLGQAIANVQESRARCLLVRGSGGSFCAGRDLKEADPETDDTRDILENRINPVLRALRHCAMPTIAAVHGPALGLGLGLALACDITLAADNAMLGSPFRNIGAVLDSGGHYFMRERLGAHRAAELIFTGRMLSGREAAEIGLINRAVGALDLDQVAAEMARSIALGPTSAFAATKEILKDARSYDEVLALESEYQARALAGHDGREGIRAFQQKRKPIFIGS